MTRVLLVENNEIHRDMLSRRLRWRSFVLIAADGEQGVAMAAAKSDLIIMD
jgi:two-component system, cell cycle response regulator DivK